MTTLKRIFSLIAVVMMLSLTAVVAQPGGGQGGGSGMGGGQRGGQGGGQGGQGGGQGQQQRERQTPEQIAAARTEVLRVELDLIDSQVEEIKAIFIEFATAAEEARKEMMSSNERPNREKMMEMQKEQEAAIVEAIKLKLSDAQLVKYEAYLKKLEEEQANRQSQSSQRSSRNRS